MTNEKMRVIAVAKEKEDTLITLGNLAAKTFRSEPDTAYETVKADLTAQGIQYLELQMRIRHMPDYMGLWYFKEFC